MRGMRASLGGLGSLGSKPGMNHAPYPPGSASSSPPIQQSPAVGSHPDRSPPAANSPESQPQNQYSTAGNVVASTDAVCEATGIVNGGWGANGAPSGGMNGPGPQPVVVPSRSRGLSSRLAESLGPRTIPKTEQVVLRRFRGDGDDDEKRDAQTKPPFDPSLPNAEAAGLATQRRYPHGLSNEGESDARFSRDDEQRLHTQQTSSVFDPQDTGLSSHQRRLDTEAQTRIHQQQDRLDGFSAPSSAGSKHFATEPEIKGANENRRGLPPTPENTVAKQAVAQRRRSSSSIKSLGCGGGTNGGKLARSSFVEITHDNDKTPLDKAAAFHFQSRNVANNDSVHRHSMLQQQQSLQKKQFLRYQYAQFQQHEAEQETAVSPEERQMQQLLEQQLVDFRSGNQKMFRFVMDYAVGLSLLNQVVLPLAQSLDDGTNLARHKTDIAQFMTRLSTGDSMFLQRIGLKFDHDNNDGKPVEKEKSRKRTRQLLKQQLDDSAIGNDLPRPDKVSNEQSTTNESLGREESINRHYGALYHHQPPSDEEDGGDGYKRSRSIVKAKIELADFEDAAVLQSWFDLGDKVLTYSSTEWSNWWTRRCVSPEPGCEMIKLVACSHFSNDSTTMGKSNNSSNSHSEVEILGFLYFERNIVDQIPVEEEHESCASAAAVHNNNERSNDGTCERQQYAKKRVRRLRTTLVRGLRISPHINPEVFRRATLSTTSSSCGIQDRVQYLGVGAMLVAHVLFQSLLFGASCVAVNSIKNDRAEAFYESMFGPPVCIRIDDGRRYYRVNAEERWDILKSVGEMQLYWKKLFYDTNNHHPSGTNNNRTDQADPQQWWS